MCIANALHAHPLLRGVRGVFNTWKAKYKLADSHQVSSK